MWFYLKDDYCAQCIDRKNKPSQNFSSMQKHENKTCPRCGQVFECKVGDILKCQCFGIELTDEEQKFISKEYNECLCRNCLFQLKQRYILFTEQKNLYKER